MNILETIITVLVIVMYICTWVAQPQLSWQYTKEFFKSGLTIFGWCKDKVVGFVNLFKNTIEENKTNESK